jgi:hypothetical protein
MADTFLQLTETPNSFNLAANKFVRVNSTADGIQFWNVTVPDLEDVDALGAYAPSTGDVLTYFSDNKWKPASPDIYSAGNGLNKVGLGFNVQAAPSGGLTSDNTGVMISDIANVAGTYGNASTTAAITVNAKGQVTSVTENTIVALAAETITDDFVGNVIGTTGQISVIGGTGNNSNATINLVATGVTAGVYGNATHAPVVTVDGYGRVSNIDLVEITGGGGAGGSGNVDLAYKTIQVAGQVDISADEPEDILTFEAGTGISLTTVPGDDKVIFTADASSIVSQADIETLSDTDTSSKADGNALVWDATAGKWVAGSVATVLNASGVTAGTYGSQGNILSIQVDDKGIITNVVETSYTQGDITSVVAGTGLTGGGTAGEVTLDLDQVGITPGTYGDGENVAQIQVDVHGRVIGITEVPTPQGDITRVNITAGTGLSGTVDTTEGDHTQTLTLDESHVKGLISAGGDLAYDNSTGVVSFTERTDAEVTGLISVTDAGGDGSLTYSNVSGVFTYTGPSASEVQAHLSAGTGIDYASGTISLEDSGVTANVYGAASSIPQITVDAKGRVTSITNIDVTDHTQSLSWNLANTTLTIGGGNSVDLSGLLDNVDTDTQTLSLAGNVITISGSSSTVDLTTALGSVTSDYGDSNVNTLLGTTSVADLTDIDTLSGIADGQALLWSATNSRFEYGNVSAGSASDAYKTISVSGQTDVVATGEDTLTLVAGAGMEITTDAGNSSVTITADPVYAGLNFGTFGSPSGGTLDMGPF